MIVDVIILAVLVIAIVVGYRDGLIRQALSLVGVIVGVLAANLLAPKLSSDTGARYEVVYVLFCVGVPFIFGMLASLLTRFVNVTVVLGTVNNMLGTLLCVAKFAVILSIAAVYVPGLIEGSAEYLDGSRAYPLLEELGRKVMSII